MAGVKGMRDKLLQSPERIKRFRASVRVALIRNRLTKHILGELQMSPTQVRACEILLSRIIPTQQHVEHSGDVNFNTFAVPLTQADTEAPEWERRTVQ